MDKETIKKLANIIEERIDIQYSQEEERRTNDRNAKPYTSLQLITFAIEEANENGELDFLNPSTVELCAHCNEPVYALIRAHHHTEIIDGVLQNVTTVTKCVHGKVPTDGCSACMLLNRS